MASGEKKRITPLLCPALPFHGLPQELVDPGLISASLALQPGQDIGIHANRHRLLDGAGYGEVASGEWRVMRKWRVTSGELGGSGEGTNLGSSERLNVETSERRGTRGDRRNV